MKIGFDGKRAANNQTGLGNYSRSLIEKLAFYFPDHEYLVYSPRVKDTAQINRFFKVPGVRLRLPESGKLFKALWRSFGIAKEMELDGLDIYHGLSNELPFRVPQGVKKVVTIHDLIYLRFPHQYGRIDRTIYNFKSKYACEQADLILAISERTKADIMHYYQIPAERIRVCYQSCDDSFKTLLPVEERNVILERYGLYSDRGAKVLPYVLSVGTIEERKNLLALVKALPLVDPGFKLVVIGRKRAYAALVMAEIERLKLQDRVIFLKDIPFTDLPAIYQGAAVFAYPSFYEGFGIPVIEAMYSGIPVIAAKGSCLEEAGGPESIYINPEDSQGLGAAINCVIGSAELREKMVAAGHKHLNQFDTAKLTSELMQAYEDVI